MEKVKKMKLSFAILITLIIISSCTAINTAVVPANASVLVTDKIYVTNWEGGPLAPGEVWAGWKWQAAHYDGDKTVMWRPVILLPPGQSRSDFRSKLTGSSVWEKHFRDTRHLVPNAPGKLNRSAPGTVQRFGKQVGVVAPAKPQGLTTALSAVSPVPHLQLDGYAKMNPIVAGRFTRKGWCGTIGLTSGKNDGNVGVTVNGVYETDIPTSDRCYKRGLCKSQDKIVEAIIEKYCSSSVVPNIGKTHLGISGIPCQDIEGGVNIGKWYLPVAKRCDNPKYSKGVPMVSLKAQYDDGSDEDWPAPGWQLIIVFRNGNPEELLTSQAVAMLNQKITKLLPWVDWKNKNQPRAGNGDNAYNFNVSPAGAVLLDQTAGIIQPY